MIAYFAVLNLLYLVFTALAWRTDHAATCARWSTPRSRRRFASPLTPPVSILLPAYDEEAGVVESVRVAAALRYPEFEVIVVNDGSRTRRSSACRRLRPGRRVRERCAGRSAARADPRRLPSRAPPRLLVVDKENGGKADALNAGLDAARYPYVCAIDADAIIERDALLRVAEPLSTIPTRRRDRRDRPDRERLHGRRRARRRRPAADAAGWRRCRSSSTSARSCSAASAGASCTRC